MLEKYKGVKKLVMKVLVAEVEFRLIQSQKEIKYNEYQPWVFMSDM